MIFLVLYAIVIWSIAYRRRRRVLGWVALLAGVPPIPLIAYVDVLAVRALTGEDVTFLYIPALVFAGVIALVGAMLALQPRPLPPHACSTCGYDLRGNVLGVCPECGETTDDRETPPARRASHDAADEAVEP